MGNKESNKNTLNVHLKMEISKAAATECDTDFNENLDSTASAEESLPESTTVLQGEEREKRKLKRKLNSEESEGEPKEKLMKSEAQLTEEDDELRCSICKELFIKAVTLTCSHTFCKYCIDYWRRNKTNCPICRTRIDSVSPTSVIDNLVVKIIDKCTDETKERRIKMIEERSVEVAAYENNAEEILLLIIIDSEASSEDEAEGDSSSSSGSEWSDETVESDQNYEEDEEYFTEDDGSEPLCDGHSCCYLCNQPGHLAYECPSRPDGH